MSSDLSNWEDEMRKWANPTSDVPRIYDEVNNMTKEIAGNRTVTKSVRADGNLSFEIGTTKLGTFAYDESTASFGSGKMYGTMHTLADFQRLRPTFEKSIKELLKESFEDQIHIENLLKNELAAETIKDRVQVGNPLKNERGETTEGDVERALVADLSQLEPGLKLYDGNKGEQYRIGDKIIDLLCTDSRDKLAVVEFKRGLPNREAIWQAAEYKALVAEELAKGDLNKVRVILLGEQRGTKDDKELDRAAKAVGIETKWYRFRLEVK
jgi:hypothetical protein